MMGIKERRFDLLPREISLEDLVPEDNFYRRLEAALDLSFVRDLVRPLYTPAGADRRWIRWSFSACSSSSSSRACAPSGS